MAYFMMNGVNLGPIIDVTELPEITPETPYSGNEHAIYRIMSNANPYVIPEEYRDSYHGMDLGKWGTGQVSAMRKLDEDVWEEGYYKPNADVDGITFPDVSEGWDRQNAHGWYDWSSFAALMGSMTENIYGLYEPGVLDEDDNIVEPEFALYWDSARNAVSCIYGEEPPSQKIFSGCYIYDGVNGYVRLDGTVNEMIGSTYTSDGEGGTVPKPLKQNGYSALLSDGTFGFPEASASTFYGTGSQCSYGTTPVYWGLLGKIYNDKSNGGFISFDSPVHPMIMLDAGQNKECFLHVDLQWADTQFYITEIATPIYNGKNSPIKFKRSGKFTKNKTTPLELSHISSTSWDKWYSIGANVNENTPITSPSDIKVIGGFDGINVSTYEYVHFSNDVPAYMTIDTNTGIIYSQRMNLQTDVFIDCGVTLMNRTIVTVKQSARLIDDNGTELDVCTRYGKFAVSGASNFAISEIWERIVWDAKWTCNKVTNPVEIVSLTLTEYEELVPKNPNAIYILDMEH